MNTLKLKLPPHLGPKYVWTLVRHFAQLTQDIDDEASRLLVDASDVVKCFPNGALSLLAALDAVRDDLSSIEVIPPRDAGAFRHMKDRNWLHLLDATRFEGSEHPFAAAKFSNGIEASQHRRKMVELLLRRVGISKEAIDAFNWTSGELMDNVLSHAGTELDQVAGYVQLALESPSSPNEMINLCVADSGRGIRNSLRESIPDLDNDVQAIHEAVRRGVTRNACHGQGNGLSGSLELARGFEGHLSVTSYSARVTWPNPLSNASFDQQVFRDRLCFPGTVVSLQMRARSSVSPGPLIMGVPGTTYLPEDVLESYCVGEENIVRLEVLAHTGGDTSRAGASQLRVLARRLLKEYPTSLLVVTWGGIDVIETSFADEFIGKLFCEFGPVQFLSRIRLDGMSPFVVGVINRAVMQRAFQTVATSDLNPSRAATSD